MSEVLYNKMLEKWIEYLEEETGICLSGITDRDSAMDLYDDLAHDFCEDYGYKEKTEELAFHGQWYDTFADGFYKLLEREGIVLPTQKGDYVQKEIEKCRR